MDIGVSVHSQKVDARAWRDLDTMDVERVARGLMAFHPSVGSIGPLLESARQEIAGLACQETVLRVYAHNPDCLFAIARVGNTVEAFEQPVGFIAQLPLNELGAQSLFNGTLDTANPDVRYICRQNERPSAIYIWCIFVSHKLAGGIALIMERLSSAKNRTAPLYCKAASEKSWSFFVTLGFQPGVIQNGKLIPGLMEYRRSTEAILRSSVRSGEHERPHYDTIEEPTQHFPPDGKFGITVVHQMDDLLKVVAIRAATYIAEHNCPYAEEFDGNDLTATHLLGYVGSEPAGCLRIRYFGEFAKLERLAVMTRFRESRLAFQLIKAGIAFCRTKGYRKLYGHAEPRLVKLWERFGFRPRTPGPTFEFSNLQFVEGDLELPPDPNTLANLSDPYVLIRPEGQWDRPGVLDRSAKRGPNVKT